MWTPQLNNREKISNKRGSIFQICCFHEGDTHVLENIGNCEQTTHLSIY